MSKQYGFIFQNAQVEMCSKYGILGPVPNEILDTARCRHLSNKD